MKAIREEVLEIITGSNLYGTNTPESDKDYIGVFIPNIEYILGFSKVEEVDLSTQIKDDLGKNTKESIDRKFYELRKYMGLAMACNPNIIETLFVNEPNIVNINHIGREILDNRHLFPHKGLKQRFLGYAFSQKHKMIIKRDNFFELKEAYEYLDKFDEKQYIMEVAIEKDCPSCINMTKDKTQNVKFVKIGDLNIQPSVVVSKARTMLKERLDKVGNRQNLMLKHGYDTKFASHLVRLLVEGKELLQTGNLVFPLKEAPMILDIKAGKWEEKAIIDYAEDMEAEIESLYETSKLPNKPRFKDIEKLCIKIMRKYI